MELRHLRYFVAVAEEENVSRAALRLHVSQPGLSRQIRDLEEELGFALLTRSAKSVHLTAAGRVFLSECRAVLLRTEAAVKTARATATGRQTELSVGYAPMPTARFLPDTLRDFQAANPGVRVKLHDLSPEQMLDGLRQGSLQLAFMVCPSRAMLRGLQFAELARDPMRLAVRRKHLLAKLRSIPLSQLVAEPLLAYSRREYPEYHDYLAKLFASVRGRARIVEEHDDGTGLVTALETGAGVALMPASLAYSSGSRLKLIPITPEPPALSVGVVWKRSTLSPTAEELLDHARRRSGRQKD